jgi:hypothetical protein
MGSVNGKMRNFSGGLKYDGFVAACLQTFDQTNKKSGLYNVRFSLINKKKLTKILVYGHQATKR